MTSKKPLFSINKYDFKPKLPEAIHDLSFANDLWPIVYIISSGKNRKKMAYVGETTDAIVRLKTHLRNDDKRKLKSIHLIESKKFNKSVTLDVESNLISYISGDGQYELLNHNIGVANHSYYQKDGIYKTIFQSIWNQLMDEGIVKHTLEHIGNSDLFKYSPYKSLSSDQQDSLLMMIDHLIDNTSTSFIIEGGAGTGKSVLAVFLFKLLLSDLSDFNLLQLRKEKDVELVEKVNTLREKYPNPKMALVIPMTSFRSTLKKVFANVGGLRSSMVVGPTDITRNKYDIILVDEAHRLRRRVNLTNYRSFDEGNKRLKLDKDKGTELDWMQMQSKQAIYFYDSFQSIKPSDVEVDDFKKLIKKSTTRRGKLKSQFRVRGGNGYVDFIHNLLDVNRAKLKPYNNPKYDLKLFDSISPMVDQIRNKDEKEGLCRLIAGYAWEWISKNKKDPNLFDFEIEGLKLRWNRITKDWINSKGSIEEVGCIHTTQGYDLNYAGVILGEEIGYDPKKKKIIIRKENYHDKNGRNGIDDPEELKEFILNIYKTILLRGIKGTYVYVCDPALRKFMASYINK